MKWRLWMIVGALASVGAAQLRAQDRVCPVSDNQLKKAQEIFEKVAEVMRHPQCINCHGAEDPFAKKTIHSGGTYDVVRDEEGNADDEKTFAECQSCHSDFKGWRTAPPGVSFVNLDDAGFCMLLDTIDPKALIRHFENDEGPDNPQFIAEGFKGTRGGAGDKPDPIDGITQAQLTQLVRDWINALGGKFHRPPDECGCKPIQYGLRVQIHATMQLMTFTFELGTIGPDAAAPVVPMHFAEDGSISGEATANTSMTNKGYAGPAFCAGAISQLARLVATGQLNKNVQSDVEKIEVKLGVNEISGHGLETCAPIPIVGEARVNQNTKGLVPYSFNFSLDPLVGATKAAPLKAPPGWTGEVQVTIVRIK